MNASQCGVVVEDVAVQEQDEAAARLGPARARRRRMSARAPGRGLTQQGRADDASLKGSTKPHKVGESAAWRLAKRPTLARLRSTWRNGKERAAGPLAVGVLLPGSGVGGPHLQVAVRVKPP